MEQSDQELIARFMSGEASGFDELLRRYERPLFSYILRIIGDRAEAEDIFQEVFMRVINNIAKYEHSQSFSAWVYRIAHNLAIDHLRKRSSRAAPTEGIEDGLDEKGLDPERAAISSQAAIAIDKALAGLSEDQRQVFILREYSGLSFKEIAEATASPLNTVLGRMHLAVKKLKSALSDYAEV